MIALTPPPGSRPPHPKPPTRGTLEAEMYEMSNPWAGSLSLNLKTASCVISPEILFFLNFFFTKKKNSFSAAFEKRETLRSSDGPRAAVRRSRRVPAARPRRSLLPPF